jgi:hypothetical protein
MITEVSNLEIFAGHGKPGGRIEAALARYLPLLWPVRQSGAAVEPNDVILRT